MAVIQGRDPAGGGVRLTVRDGRVAALERTTDADPAAPWLVPGLVDLQVNGYGGFDVNGPDASPDAVAGLVDALARAGTTTVVPTVITASQAAIEHALDAVARAVGADGRLRRAIPYVHVEGPHLSEVDGPRGAHDLAQIRPASLDEFDAWQRAADGLIGMVTLSPHWPGTVEYVQGLAARGVRVSVGHTHAGPEQIRDAVDAGARYATHLGNGIQATLPRHPNAIWTQLADDRLTAGFIADGHHLPEDALRAMIRAKGLDRSFVVSDSVALAGSAPGRYRQPVGGEVELHADGRLNVAGTPYLAGAALPLRAAFGTLTRAGFAVADAVALCATNPARIAGLPVPLAVGSPADVLLLDPDDFSVVEVVSPDRPDTRRESSP